MQNKEANVFMLWQMTLTWEVFGPMEESLINEPLVLDYGNICEQETRDIFLEFRNPSRDSVTVLMSG